MQDLVQRLRGIAERQCMPTFNEAANRIEKLERENAELCKDAERYRWLKTGFRAMSLDMGGNHTWVQRSSSMLRGPSVDEAIDAAMKEQT